MGAYALSKQRRTTTEEARRVGHAIGVGWDRFDLEQFRDPVPIVKIAPAHMTEFPDYYEPLEQMAAEAEREWAAKRSSSST